MTPITKELIFCRIEKLQAEKNSIQTSIDRIIERNDIDSMEFIEIWQIDIELIESSIEHLKKLLFK